MSFSSSGLIDFINNDTDDLVTLIITRVQTSAQAISFASREHVSFAPPLLTLTASAVPEPSTYALIAFGLVGSAVMYKKRQNA